jgi:hypothetical protein
MQDCKGWQRPVLFPNTFTLKGQNFLSETDLYDADGFFREITSYITVSAYFLKGVQHNKISRDLEKKRLNFPPILTNNNRAENSPMTTIIDVYN